MVRILARPDWTDGTRTRQSSLVNGCNFTVDTGLGNGDRAISSRHQLT